MDQHSRTAARWIFLILIATCINTTCAWAGSPKFKFRIPAGQASRSLQQFYEQSQVPVLFLSENIEGVSTHEVTGEFSAADALARLLLGTGLAYEFAEGTALIRRAPRAAATGAGPIIPPIYDGRNETKLDEILVTGSLIHGVFDISSPLVLVDRREVQKTGYATVQDVLRALPAAATIGRDEVFGGPGNINRGSSINLRGLGDGATLVLVNGRRQPPSGTRGDFVDVSNIPWSMVDHIEVLPDGGSALYGSDAIAGVVNIILRNELEGAETQVRYGTARDGAAESMVAQVFGHSWATGHWFAGYQYSHRTELMAADRGFTANADKRAEGGSDYRRISSNPGNILDPRTLLPIYAIPRGQGGSSLAASDLLPSVINYQNQFANVALLPDSKSHSVYFTGSQDLGEHVKLFAEGRYGQRNTRQTPLATDVGPFVVPATNPFFVSPNMSAPFVLVAYDFANDLGPFRINGQTKNYSGTLGLKTEFSHAWQASLSASYARESLYSALYGQIDRGALNAALADPNPTTAFNPFGDGSHTNPDTLARIDAGTRYHGASTIPTLQLQADGPFLHLPAGDAKAAIGAEYREESLNVDVRGKSLDPQTIFHIQLSRAIAAAYTELSVPLIGDAHHPHLAPRLELSLAGRYEHYSDFGHTFNPKIGLRWAPVQAVKLRVSWGTSFKAPNLTDLEDGHNLTGLTILNDSRSATGRSTIVGLQGGNPDLKEERATTWTTGIDFAPSELPGFQLSLTGYSIDYKDQVIQPGPPNPSDILSQEDQWAAVITRNPSQSQIDALCNSPNFFGDRAQCGINVPTLIIDIRKHNLAITKVTGLDVTLSQALATDYGHFNVGLNGTYVFHFRRAFTNTAPTVDIVDTANNPLALRLRGTIDWQQHGDHQAGFGAHLTTNYTGGNKDPGSSSRSAVNSWTTFDIGLNYRIDENGHWADNTEFALSVVNVLNEDPPFVDQQYGFDTSNAQPVGRVINASLTKRW